MLLKVNRDVESIHPFTTSLSQILDAPSTYLDHDLIVQRQKTVVLRTGCRLTSALPYKSCKKIPSTSHLAYQNSVNLPSVK
jgi:hypothetical protein